MEILIAVGVIAALVWFAKYSNDKHGRDLYIICSNQFCEFKGEGKECGSKAWIALLLTFFFVIPGILYVLHEGPHGIYCPRCGKRAR